MKYLAELFKRWGIWSGDPEMESHKPSKESDLSSDTATTTALKPATTPWMRAESDNLQCNDEKDFPGHADISPLGAAGAIGFVCSAAEKEYWGMRPGDGPYWVTITDEDTHDHRFTWSWIEGCTMENPPVPLNDPFGEGGLDARGKSRCDFSFANAWAGCEYTMRSILSIRQSSNIFCRQQWRCRRFSRCRLYQVFDGIWCLRWISGAREWSTRLGAG
jgi:hypothetical protein